MLAVAAEAAGSLLAQTVELVVLALEETAVEEEVVLLVFLEALELMVAVAVGVEMVQALVVEQQAIMELVALE
jgi:hypothetical protein